jgi:ribonucleoside-diphosphate reductase subunit M2
MNSNLMNLYMSSTGIEKQKLFAKVLEENTLLQSSLKAPVEKEHKESLLASPEEMKKLIETCKYLEEPWKSRIIELIGKTTPYISREEEMQEEILKENPNRFVTLPIEYIDVWIFYKLEEASFWVVEEIDFSSDLKDWNTLSKDEQFFLKHVLAFFAASDGIVGENIISRFMQEVQISEARSFYAFQVAMEYTHSFNYSLMIDTYVKDAEEKVRLFAAIHNNPAVKLKAQWALKWIKDNCASFAERLFAIACVEGIFFSSSFCAIFWLKKRGESLFTFIPRFFH